MKRAFLAGLVVVWAGSMGATIVIGQDEEGGRGARRAPAPTTVTSAKVQAERPKTVKVEVPVTQAVRSDTPVFRGEGYFQQKCGTCHLGRWRKAGQLKPALSLAGVLKDTSKEREADVREAIRRGSINMPGFQNTFTPAEFEDLIAYLKTL
jgi:mono/diheme cytochrome c family protein